MDYSKHTKHGLKAICKERNIKGISKKNKSQLIELLKNYDTNKKCEEKTDVKTEKNEKDDKKIDVKDEAKTETKTEPKSDVKDEDTHTLDMSNDTYDDKVLKEQYQLHKSYVQGRIESTRKTSVIVRFPCIPEDISENIVKQIIRNKLNDKTSTWDCKKGDLQSQKEGKQECKCFTSDGPLSFTPSSDWDVIYFLDAREWLNNKFVLYRIPLKMSSPEWKNIKVSRTQTFEDQAKQGRRPRLTWDALEPQVRNYTTKVYEGTFEDIFIPVEATE